MVQKILCVAEKPAIAKAVANHLAGGLVTTVSMEKLCLRGLSNQFLATHPGKPVCEELRV